MRRQFTSEQKAAILKRHLVDKVGVSDVCDEYQLQPSQLYEWQRKLMKNAAVALEGGRSEPASKTRQLEEQIARLEGASGASRSRRLRRFGRGAGTLPRRRRSGGAGQRRGG